MYWFCLHVSLLFCHIWPVSKVLTKIAMLIFYTEHGRQLGRCLWTEIKKENFFFVRVRLKLNMQMKTSPVYPYFYNQMKFIAFFKYLYIIYKLRNSLLSFIKNIKNILFILILVNWSWVLAAVEVHHISYWLSLFATYLIMLN